MDLEYAWCERDGWAYLHNVVPCCTTECLGYVFNRRCRAREATRLVDRVVQDRFPDTCKAPGTRLGVDNGPAFRSNAFVAHATALGFDVEHIQVTTPEDNGVMKTLHPGPDRDYFRVLLFDTFDEANPYIEWAFHHYNKVEPSKCLRRLMAREYCDEVTAIANQN